MGLISKLKNVVRKAKKLNPVNVTQKTIPLVRNITGGVARKVHPLNPAHVTQRTWGKTKGLTTELEKRRKRGFGI